MKAEAKRMAALGFPDLSMEKPPQFPMKFKEFLRRMFGGRLHGDRLHLYRKFVYQNFLCVEWHRGGHASQTERESEAQRQTDEWIAKLNRDGIGDPAWFGQASGHIAEWRKANRVHQRKEANRRRWLKENRKKILWLLQRRISDLSHAKKCRLASSKAKKATGSHRQK